MRFRRVLLFLAVTWLCQSGNLGLAASRFSLSLSRNSDVPALFVSKVTSRKTAIFNAKFMEIGSFAAPGGVAAVDRDGYFYDTVNNQLLVFAPPYKSKPHVLTWGAGYNLYGVAIDPKSKGFAVVVATGGSLPTLSVDFFRSRNTYAPCAVVQVPTAGLLDGAAFDREGKLFSLDYGDSQGGGYMGMISIAGGCSANTYSYNAFRNFSYFVGEVAVDKNDDFALQSGRVLYVFSHPSYGRFGQPKQETQLGNVAFDSLSSDGLHFWGSTYPLGGSGMLSEYAYPQGGKPIITIAFKDPAYVAVFPPLAP